MKASMKAVALWVIAQCLSMPIASAREAKPRLTRDEAKARAAVVDKVRYDLDMHLDAQKDFFKGAVKVSFELKSVPPELSLDLAGGIVRELTVNGIAKDPKLHNGFFIQLPTDALKVGSNEVLVQYQHPYSHDGSGLYRFQDPVDKRVYLYTHFEPYDANQLFPGFDQPDLKATYRLMVSAPKDWNVITSVREQNVTEQNGQKRWQFPESQTFSTYLFSLHAGPYHVWEKDFRIPLRLFARQSIKDQVRSKEWFEVTEKGFDFFESYFDEPYPFKKYDQVIVADFNAGAMENVAAVTFSEKYLTRGKITQEKKIGHANTILHEMAHMWFGNLVTMRWWDDLWLNEGFATWMEGRTSRKLHPEWDTSGVDAAFTSRGAMGGDAYATTHPIVQHVATVEQASQAFDGITYGKGSAVISMLEDYVGEDAWRNGVRSYIAAHAYGNAVTDDLWAEVEKAAPGKQFVQVAHDFTLQPGVPLIRASSTCVAGETRLLLEQGEYTVDRPGKTPLRWRVPVKLRTADGHVVPVLVDGKAEIGLPGCGGPVLVNAGQKGYFRTLYAPAQFKTLTASFASLPVVDQMGVMMDTSALAAIGMQPEADSLDLAMQVPLDAAPELWQMVAGALGGLDDLYKGDAKRQAAIRTFVTARLAPKFAQLGWDIRAGDTSSTKQLRTSLIAVLGELGDARVLAEARRRFDAFLQDPASLSPDLRRSVLGMVARNADAATWDRLHMLARAEKSSMLRDQYYGLLAMAKDKALAQRALDMALTDEPGATNGASMISGVSREHPELAFDFAVAHREKVNTLVDSTSLARYYPGLGSASTELAMVDRINAFAEKYIAPTSRRDAARVVNGIQTRVKLRQQRLPQIDAWLKSRGV